MSNSYAIDLLSEGVREFGFELLYQVVATTPVDTGAARSNWMVTFGKPSAGTIPPKDDSGTAAVADGWEQFEKIDANNIPSSIYISNNLPYIERLNEGWSQQAPAKYVEAAISRVIENGRL